MGEGPIYGVEAVQPTLGADPQYSAAVEQQGRDAIIAQTGRLVRIATISGELPQARVEAVESTLAGTHPQVAVAVFGQGGYPAVADGIRVVRIGAVNGESIAIVAVQAVLCAEPQEALRVLQDDVDRVLRQSLFDANALEADRGVVAAAADDGGGRFRLGGGGRGGAEIGGGSRPATRDQDQGRGQEQNQEGERTGFHSDQLYIQGGSRMHSKYIALLPVRTGQGFGIPPLLKKGLCGRDSSS